MREAASEIEKAGNAGNLDVAKANMAELETQFNRLKEAMQKDLGMI